MECKSQSNKYLANILRLAFLLTVLILMVPVLLSVLGPSNSLFSYYCLFCLLFLLGISIINFKALYLVFWEGDWFSKTLLFLGTFLFALTLLSGLILPVTARDALVHHLAIPDLWREAGAISEISWHPWSYYPMLIQSVYCGLLSFAPWPCTLFHGLFLLLTAQLCALLQFHFSSSSRQSAFLFFLLLSLPVTLSLASTPLVDLALLFFCCAAIAALYIDRKILTRALYFGVFLGAALSSKYNALLFCVALVLAVPFIFGLNKKQMQQLVYFGLIAFFFCILAYSYWLFRNYSYTGNPFYPLFNKMFGVESSGGYSMSGLKPLEKRFYLYNESFLEVLLLPFRMLLYGEEGNPRKFDGVLSPLLLFSLVPVFVDKLRTKYLGLIILLVVYVVMSLTFGPARVRYLAPIFFVFCILASEGLFYLLSIKANVMQKILPVIVGLQVVWVFYHPPYLRNLLAVKDIVTGQQTTEQYKHKEVPEYSVIARVNETVPPDSCVYLAYTGNLFYWYTGCALSDGYHSASKLIATIKSRDSHKSLDRYFVSMKIDYMLVHTRRLKMILDTNLSNTEKAVWSNYANNNLELVFNDHAYSLWKIKKAQ